MSAAQTERVLELIDHNLEMNREEVLSYIAENEERVAEELLDRGQVDIPTSAGPVTLKRQDFAA